MRKHRPHRLKLRITLPILIILITCSLKSNAQDLGVGFKAGLEVSTQLNNFTFQSGDLALDLDPKISTGYHLGLIYRNRFARNFRLQAEPTFLRLTSDYNESFIFRDFEFQTKSETKLSYLHLPIVLEITTTPPDLEEFPKPWEETTYHAKLGFYGSYLIDATFKGVNSGAPIGVEFEEEFSNDITSLLNSYDAGIIIGAGLEYGYQNKLGIESRLLLGFIDSGNSQKNEIRAHNLSISFALYYLL